MKHLCNSLLFHSCYRTVFCNFFRYARLSQLVLLSKLNYLFVAKMLRNSIIAKMLQNLVVEQVLHRCFKVITFSFQKCESEASPRFPLTFSVTSGEGFPTKHCFSPRGESVHVSCNKTRNAKGEALWRRGEPFLNEIIMIYSWRGVGCCSTQPTTSSFM